MFAWRLLFLCVGLLWCAGLSAGEAGSTNATSTAKRARIVVLGDSITAGYGLRDSAQAYPAQLQQKIDEAGWPYEVVNAGVSGDTTAGGLRRVDWALRPGAEVLIVALGGNDGLRGLAPAQTAENLAGIVKRAREKAPGVAILIAGMEMPANFGADYTSAFRALFPKVAADNSTELIPFLLAGVGGVPTLNQEDSIHPNPAGQKQVAENVWKTLQPLLAKRQSK